MSEDKVRRKDWCWSVRTVYVLGKLSDVSGPGLEEAGRYRMVSKLGFDPGTYGLWAHHASAGGPITGPPSVKRRDSLGTVLGSFQGTFYPSWSHGH